ncbi:FAD dependent oxidoreductase [Pycnococcus provasolii]
MLGTRATSASASASAMSRVNSVSASPRGMSRPNRRISASASSASSVTTLPASPNTKQQQIPSSAEVVIVGAGFGGLAAAAVLAHEGIQVEVFEAHDTVGGAAHSFQRRTPDGNSYTFDSGPSYFMGLSESGDARSTNALAQLLRLLDEPVPQYTYLSCDYHLPEGVLRARAGGGGVPYDNAVRELGGESAYQQLKTLRRAMEPLARVAEVTPFAALRSDAAAALTIGRSVPRMSAAIARALAADPSQAAALPELAEGFDATMRRAGVTDPFLTRLMNLECFVISGCLADQTAAAAMAYLFAERSREDAVYDYPQGGAMALCEALKNAAERRGAKIHLKSPVARIKHVDGVASGVELTDGREVEAKRAVITGVSAWDTLKLLGGQLDNSSSGDSNLSTEVDALAAAAGAVPPLDSFLHLHAVIPADALPPANHELAEACLDSPHRAFDAPGAGPNGTDALNIHYLHVRDWSDGVVDSPLNVVNVSIPTALDPSASTDRNMHVLHAYGAANESFSLYESELPADGSAKYASSSSYQELKAQRKAYLYDSLRAIFGPDIEQRVAHEWVGTPLTQRRFVNRFRGAYAAGRDVTRVNMFDASKAPGADTSLQNLFACGDCVSPGVGVPAAVASGIAAANRVSGVGKHLSLLNELSEMGYSV